MEIKYRKKEKGIKVEFVSKTTLKKIKSKTVETSGFEAKKGQNVIVNKTIYFGIDGIKDNNDWRDFGYLVVQKVKTFNIKNISIELPINSNGFLEGLVLGDYEFKKYKSEYKDSKLKNIYILGNKKLKPIIKESLLKTKAQCLTRDWVNTTPEDANSKTIERAIVNLFKGSSIKVKVYGEKKLKSENMNAHLAVNRSSRHKAKTIKLSYEPKNYDRKKDKHHILVMKTLTYDSGGLSIKPSNSMTSMKADKAGGMVGFGVMSALKDLKSKNKITVYLGIAENMIDGSSYKPDDVLVAKNGKTIHIKNTDAEGRLVLFDNLCLAQSENKKFSTISTWATLTGAAVFQFGDEAAGLVGFNKKLKKSIKKAGEKAGEIFLNAEFHKFMMNGVDDSIADLTNTGTPNMGCQKAGLFLTNALKEKNKNKYVHVDIAGPSFVSKPFGHNPAGATGFGVRTILNFFNSK